MTDLEMLERHIQMLEQENTILRDRLRAFRECTRETEWLEFLEVVPEASDWFHVDGSVHIAIQPMNDSGNSSSHD